MKNADLLVIPNLAALLLSPVALCLLKNLVRARKKEAIPEG